LIQVLDTAAERAPTKNSQIAEAALVGAPPTLAVARQNHAPRARLEVGVALVPATLRMLTHPTLIA
jgi:hypothetical protein